MKHSRIILPVALSLLVMALAASLAVAATPGELLPQAQAVPAVATNLSPISPGPEAGFLYLNAAPDVIKPAYICPVGCTEGNEQIDCAHQIDCSGFPYRCEDYLGYACSGTCGCCT